MTPETKEVSGKLPISGLLAGLLCGCAFTGNQDMKYGVKQPRALAWGIGMPSCLILCTAEFSITQGERNGDGTSMKGGDQTTTISPTYAPQDNDSTTLSPSLSGVK